MKNLNAFVTRLALIVGLLSVAGTVHAQTTINSTTLTSNMSATQSFVVVGAVTCTGCTLNAATSGIIYIDQEAMCVSPTYVSGLTVPVTRGCLSTKQAAHLAVSVGVAKVVFLGPAVRFKQGTGTNADAGDPPPGYCGPKTQYQFLPWINISNGKEWICNNYDWTFLSNISSNGSTPSR